MRTIVTGGAGFIGSHIAEASIEAGHSVLVVDNLSHGKRENIPTKADFAEVDVTSAEVERLIIDFKPNTIFHLAAQMDVRQSVLDPAFDTRVNVEGTVRIGNAALRAKTDTIIFASTGGAIYGEQDVFPAPESHPTKPVSPYGLSKRCAELYLTYFSQTSRLRTVFLRFANVYGPRQDPHGEAGVVAIFAEKMLQRQAPVINGDGGQTRDYVFVGDVVSAALLALTKSSAQGPINIGTGIETDVNTLARTLAQSIGYSGPIKNAAAKPGEQRRSVLDNRLAKQILGWQPQVNLASGLKDTALWFAKTSKTAK